MRGSLRLLHALNVSMLVSFFHFPYQLFEERVNLVLHWFDLWTDRQRKHLLHSLLTRCTKSQYCRDLLIETVPVTKVDLTSVLPRFLSLYVMSFLSPRDLCKAAQVSWHWRVLAEQDCLWAGRCIRRGWFLPYTPGEKEFGAWKSHYVSCLSTLDWLTPREAAEMYGTLNQQSTGMTEEEEERRREKRIRQQIREKLREEKSEWKRKNRKMTGCRNYSNTFLSETRKIRGALSSFIYRPAQPHTVSPLHLSAPALLLLISNRIPAYELVLSGVKPSVTAVLYDHRGTLSSLLTQVERAISGKPAQRIGLLACGGTQDIHLLHKKTLLTPDHREFWEKLCGMVAPTEEGGGIDIFCPLAASASGVTLLQNLSTLTGLEVRAPVGVATGNFQNIWLNSIFLGYFLWERIRLDEICVSRDLSEALIEGLTALTREEEVGITVEQFVYKEPLTAALNSNRAILSYADIHVVLSPVAQILELNRVFQADLQVRLQQWGAEKCIGDVFVKFCSKLKVYTNYLNNYTTAIQTIDKCRESKPSFRAFLKRSDRTLATHMLSLQELLLCPVWRMQEYVTLLQALSLHTHPGHPDHAHLRSALNTLLQFREFIHKVTHELRAISHVNASVVAVLALLLCICTLFEENRQLIMTQDAALHRSPDEQIPDSLKTYQHVCDVGLFLLNNALVLTRQNVRHTPFMLAHQSTHTFLASVALTSLSVREIRHTRYVSHAFVLEGPCHSWVCATQRGEERRHFLSVLRSAIECALAGHQ
uniref:Epithelial cell transforming 2 like n=1 Tax=Maylandia zebra TaxID=106582 RepID=A0A3P9CNM8_9CICH